MSALVLTLKEQPPQRCDLSALIPERLAESRSIEKLDIRTTRIPLAVGDIFSVTPGDPSDIRIEGGSERFDNLGAGLTHGRIHVAGDLGQKAGRGMSGGEMMIDGSVGRLAGSAMGGGRIEISGDAGDLLGAPLPGEIAGMRGGTIQVSGTVGTRAGDRMRRGLIAIGGDAGMHVASRMGGGTIVCFGGTGALPGYLMSRGTLILGRTPAALAPTFVDTGTHELVALRLLARWLATVGIDAVSLLTSRLHRLVGDTAVLGKGEIFVPEITRP